MCLRTILPIAVATLVAVGCATSNKTTESPDDDEPVSRMQPILDCTTLELSEDTSPEPKSLPFSATGPVASVDGQMISASDFNREAATFADGMAALSNVSNKKTRKRFATQVVDQLIDKHIVEQTLETHSVTVTQSEIDDELDDFKKNLGSDEQFQDFLDRKNMDKHTLRAQICRDLRLRAMLAETRAIEVTSSEARDYYRDNKQNWQRKEQVKARHILLELDEDASSAEVQEVRERARKLADEARNSGSDFAELARLHSEGPSAQKGGDLGYFSADRMVQKFSDAAFSLRKGQISDPVRTKFGFHVIKVLDHRPARTQSFEEVRDEVVEKLKEKKLRSGLQKFLKEKKSNLEIETFPDNISVK